MKRYDEQFKQDALRRVRDGQSVASVARDLGISEGLIHEWKKRFPVATEENDKETARMKREIRELRMENEILKKAALIFGRGG